MKRELELFLRNARIVNQTNVIIEKHPYRFMRAGVWVTQYVVHIGTTIPGLNLRGLISNYADGVVETSLIFSCYGDYHLSAEEIKRREKIINHITSQGASYQEEPQIQWFN